MKIEKIENERIEQQKQKQIEKKIYQDLVSRQTLVQIQDIQFQIYPKSKKLILLRALKQ